MKPPGLGHAPSGFTQGAPVKLHRGHLVAVSIEVADRAVILGQANSLAIKVGLAPLLQDLCESAAVHADEAILLLPDATCTSCSDACLMSACL